MSHCLMNASLGFYWQTVKNHLSSNNTFNPLFFNDLLMVYAHAMAVDHRPNTVDYCKSQLLIKQMANRTAQG